MTTTKTTRPTNRVVLRFALAHLKRLKRQEAEYYAEVEAWYRSGDGRSPKWVTEVGPDGDVYRVNKGGEGYTFPHCIHGASRWVDWDCNCGPCESGDESVYALAMQLGWNDWETWTRRFALLRDAENIGAPNDVLRPLREWALASLDWSLTTPIRRNLP